MTDEPSDLEEHSQQANADMTHPSSQLSNGAENPEQSRAKMDLETTKAQLDSLIHNFREGQFRRTSRRIITYCDYRFAKINADHHRLNVRLQDPVIIDLDSATDTGVFHIEQMMDFENLARDACYEAINSIRSELTALKEVLEMSSQVLRLVNETSGNDIIGSSARGIAAWNRAQQRSLIANLDRFR